jgi:energy-coupling factor transport system substrate-specific component
MTWSLASLLLLGAVLVTGIAWFERTHPSTRVIALVATLAALAALGRGAFAPLPNVKPTTDIVLIAGLVLGGAPGFMVGAVAALASNLFFGQGPWTPWQMAAWGAIGVAGALLARAARGREIGRGTQAIVCGFARLAFGAVMNLHMWILDAGDHCLAQLGAYFATSLPFDLAHAAGNVAFALAFGPALIRALERFRMRMEVTWLPSPTATARVAPRPAPAATPSR